MKTLKVMAVLAGACALCPAGGIAQSYPVKPVRIVVGFAPGGGVDMSARAVGKYLGDGLGQQIIVDNRPGAAGNIGAALVAKSSPDGYTMLMSNSTISTPGLFLNMPFDVTKDLEPVSLVAIGPSVLDPWGGSSTRRSRSRSSTPSCSGNSRAAARWSWTLTNAS